MTGTERDSDDAQTRDLQRRLLDSALADAPPSGATAQAWARFSALLAVSAASSGLTSSARSVEKSPRLKLALAKHLLLGALGGWGLTYLWFEFQHAGPKETPQSVLSNTPRSGQRVDPTQHEATNLRAEPTGSSMPSPPELAVASAQHRLVGPPTRRASRALLATPPLTEPKPEDSSLAAEVSALDAARAASASGDIGRSLDLLERYRRDFPSGVLRGDAEVAVIEALYARGDRLEAAKRAAYFLAHSPNDPHSATVRQFIPR
jgi:hypothetical protein